MALRKRTTAIVRSRDSGLYAVLPAGLAPWLYAGAEIDISFEAGKLILRRLHGSRRPGKEGKPAKAALRRGG